MRALFFSFFMSSVHFGTELELMTNHLNKNDEVFVVNCTGQLKSCFFNPEHRKSLCYLCKAKFKRGMSLLEKSQKRVHLINIDINNNIEKFNENFESVEQLKKFEYQNFKLGWLCASTLIARLKREHKFNTLKYKAEINKQLNISWYVYQTALSIISKTKPSRVYVFNGRFAIEGSIIQACKKNKLDYYTHERSGTTKRYLLRKNALPHDIVPTTIEINKLWSKNKSSKLQVAKNWFLNLQKGNNPGWIAFSKNQSKNLLPQTFSMNKTNIAIFNSTIEEYSSVPGWQNPLYLDENRAIEDILEKFKDSKSLFFYLRMHPNQINFDNTQAREIRKMQKEYKKNFEVIFPESKVSSYSLIKNCQKVITFASTIGVEACFMKKPVILIGRAFYENLNVCYKPKTKTDVYNLINFKLIPRPIIGALKYGYWQVNGGIPYRHYQAKNLYSGQFNNQSLEPGLGSKLIYKIMSAII